MSEQRPLRREDFRRVMSHSPFAECGQLCDEKKRLEEQWFQAETEEEKRRLELLIRAILTRMQWMHCPDCPLPQ
jgi:hypothetical protein